MRRHISLYFIFMALAIVVLAGCYAYSSHYRQQPNCTQQCHTEAGEPETDGEFMMMESVTSHFFSLQP